MSLTEDVCLLLDERGYGTYDPVGGNIFPGDLPPEPDFAFAVTPYPGAASDVKNSYERPRVQITVRDNNYHVAEQTAVALHGDLARLSGRPLGDAWLVLVVPVQGRPYWLPRETSGNRHRFVVNVELHLRQPTAQRI